MPWIRLVEQALVGDPDDPVQDLDLRLLTPNSEAAPYFDLEHLHDPGGDPIEAIVSAEEGKVIAVRDDLDVELRRMKHARVRQACNKAEVLKRYPVCLLPEHACVASAINALGLSRDVVLRQAKFRR